MHAFYRAPKAFCTWLEAEGSVEVSPMKRVRAPEQPVEQLEPVSMDDACAILGTSGSVPAQ